MSNRSKQSCSGKMLRVFLALATLAHTCQAAYLFQSASQIAYHQQQQQMQQSQAQAQAQTSQQDTQAPIINSFAFSDNVRETQRVHVMCSTSSGETPLTFSWLKDGQPVSSPAAVKARKIQILSDGDSSTLKINLVRLDHAGNYTCVAKNRFGSAQYTAQLVVMAEPRWLKEPPGEPIVATRGQTIVIDCQTTGWPRPQQTWHIKTHTPNSEFVELERLIHASLSHGRVSLEPNGSLVIRNADKSDEANYLCKSANGIGHDISRGTSLKVTVPAHFEQTARHEPISARKSRDIQLRCDAFGDQPIAIDWFKDGRALLVDGRDPLIDSRYSIHNTPQAQPKNGLISQLYIKQTQRLDNGVYECRTHNHHGRDRLQMELLVQEEPDSIQNLQVVQMNSRSVTLAWSEPYNGRVPINSYMFQYKRVAAANSLLDNHWTDSYNLDSYGSPEQSDQQQQQQQQVFKSSASSYLADDDWQHATRIMLPQQQQQGQNSSLGDTKSITIEKLEASSKYVLRTLAINSIGQSKFSAPMEFVTQEEAPAVGPVNIRAEAVNSTSIQVSWDEISRARHVGRIHGYYVGYRVASNNTSAAVNFTYKPYIINDLAATPQLKSQLERLSMVLHDLRRDTMYEITVVAFNLRGTGPSADFVLCKTIEMEAPKPVRLTIRRESNESIFIEWQRDASDQNPVDDYVLYQEKNSASQEWLQVRLPGNQTHYKAPGLKCGTRYQFYITAHNKVGKSAPSEVVSASTSGALPALPSKTSLIKWLNSTCLLINLNSFQDNGCRIKTFTVRYRVDKTESNSTSVVVSSTGSGASATSTPSQQQQQQQQQTQQQLQQQLQQQQQQQQQQQSLEWIAIRPKSNLKQQRANEEDRMEYLCDLSPTGEYTIHVAAANDVGRSEIEYSVLMSSDELRHSLWKELNELLSAGMPNIFAYIPSLIIFLLALLMLAILSLILYTTAMKYYQKFVIMQNQMRATRRAKADEKRRRKLASGMGGSSRQSQKLADEWVGDYEEEEEEVDEDDSDDDDDDDELDDDDNQVLAGSGAGNHQVRGVEGDDEDDGTATDELRSASSSNCSRQQQQRSSKQRRALLTRGRSHLSHHTHRPQFMAAHQQQQQHHQYSGSGGHHYLSNLTAFDSSSIDSPPTQCHPSLGKQCGGGGGGSGMSTASTDSMLGNGRFQCLNSAKQYQVKMNDYSMLPTISATLSPPTARASDIYGTTTTTTATTARHVAQHSSPGKAHQQLHQYRMRPGTSPSGASSSSASQHTQATTATAGSNNAAQSFMQYSTLRRTNMQTYLPQQRQQQQQQLTRSTAQQQQQRQQLSDIYGYYMAPGQQQQQQQVAAAAAAAAAAQQAANEAANSIFVPPQQQIVYSAPNIRRQPPVFL